MNNNCTGIHRCMIITKKCSLFLIKNTLNLHAWVILWNMHFCSCSDVLGLWSLARLSGFSWCCTAVKAVVVLVWSQFAVFLKIIGWNYSWRASRIISLSSFGDLSKVDRVSCPFLPKSSLSGESKPWRNHLLLTPFVPVPHQFDYWSTGTTLLTTLQVTTALLG